MESVDRDTCYMERDFVEWNERVNSYVTSYTCSTCGDAYLHIGGGKPKACPNCGRRVKEAML